MDYQCVFLDYLRLRFIHNLRTPNRQRTIRCKRHIAVRRNIVVGTALVLNNLIYTPCLKKTVPVLFFE